MGKTSRLVQTALLAVGCLVAAAVVPAVMAENVHARSLAPQRTAGSGSISYAGRRVAAPARQDRVHASAALHSHTRHVSFIHPSAAYQHSSAASAGDYLSCMGGESRWPDGKVIHVYVAPGKPTYCGIVAGCFNQWSAASQGRIRWQMCSSPAQADYRITWTRRQHELRSGTEAGLTTTDTTVDKRTGREYIRHAQTSVLTRFDGRNLSDNEVEQTILHELGHGLGLEGHSPDCHDIMYYAVDPKQSCYLSQRDKNTLCRLYSD